MRSTAVAYRVAHGIAPAAALDEKSGYPIGRMRLAEIAGDMALGISEPQFLAAQNYEKIVRLNASIMGFAQPHPKAINLDGPSGIACRPDLDNAIVRDIRARFAAARQALLAAGAEIGVGSRINQAVYAVVIEQVNEHSLTEDQIGFLRIGLNALDKLFR